jgi:hypothetical protein
MSGLLLSLLFVLQGIPIQHGGKVSGVLRDSMGTPMSGVRVAAVARGDTVEAVAAGAAMAGLAETDEQGRFTLEDIPPGRYAIAAGRLDLQTYYPGTRSLADARVLTITAGETITGINFVLDNSSFGRSPTGFLVVQTVAPISVAIPVRVVTQGGVKLPVWSNGGPVSIRLESTTFSTQSIPIDGSLFSVPGPVMGDVRVVIDNLPNTHEIESITYGASDITRGTFRLSDANFPTIPSTAVSATGPISTPAQFSTTANPVNAITQSFLIVTGSGGLLLSSSPPRSAVSPPSMISITIGPGRQPFTSGVRITGRTGSTNKRPIYISGRPGVLYSDGSFEFSGVAPGLHLIAAMSVSKPMAALINVGNRDIEGVELQETLVLPDDVRIPKDPLPSERHTPDAAVPLPRIRGVVLEEQSKAQIREGEVEITVGATSRRIAIDAEGRFETFPLVPGKYDFKLQIFGHTSNGKMVTIEDQDLTLELTSRRLY